MRFPSARASALALALCLPSLALAAPSVRSGPTLQVARKGHTAVRLNDGRVLVVGGVTSSARGPGAELFDPRSGRFRAVDTSEDRFRGYVSAAPLRDGRVFLSWTTNGETQVWLFDPKTDAVRRARADLPFHLAHLATPMQDGRVLISGGHRHLYAYDPRSDSVSQIGDRSSRGGDPTHTATALRGGEVVLMAGGKFTDMFSTHSRDFAQLVRANGTETPGTLGTQRYDHTALSVGSTRALIVGGRRSRGWFRSHAPVATLELFDLNTKRFARVDSLDHARWGCAAVRDGGDVVIAGGADRADELRSVEVYSIRLERVTTERFDLRAKRAFHTATRLLDGRILVVGGEADGQRLRSSELIRR